MDKRWIVWISVLLGLLALGLGGYWWLPGRPGAFTGMFGTVAIYLWVLWGLLRAQIHPLVRRGLVIVFSAAATVIIGHLFIVIGRGELAIAIVGVWAMAVAFTIGLGLIRLLLSPGTPIIGIARTLVDEAIRMRIALVFIIGLLLLVPVLPFVLDPTERLEYRLKFFLTWSVAGTGLLLSLLTILLSCSTICSEISNRQIFLSMSKSVSRAEYLLGKWLGISLLNLLLLSVAFGGVYAMARIVQGAPVQERSDRVAVDEQVMVARVAISPKPPATQALETMFNERLAQLKREKPAQYEGELTENDRQGVLTSVLVKWHTIGRLQEQTFVFEDVDRAKGFGETVQLRLKPKLSKTPPDEMVWMAFWLNDRPFPVDRMGRHQPVDLARNNFHVVNLPLAAVDEDGVLAVRIKNVDLRDPESTLPASITFAPHSDIELLYTVGRFEPNLIRAMLMIWLRLVFLAALGLTAGTFLGFPVACLFTLMIYCGASTSTFLVEALGGYAGSAIYEKGFGETISELIRLVGVNLSQGATGEAARLVLRIIGEIVVKLLPSFSTHNPVPLLADGRLVPMRMVGWGALSIGVLWGGGCALVGWWIFRGRELARIVV